MNIWKSLLEKLNLDKTVGKEKELPSEFRNWVRMSIRVLGKNSKNKKDGELFDSLVNNGIPEFDAGEITIFLPVAFCRKLLPELDWPPNYYDFYSKEKQIKRKYRKNLRYLIIEEETNKFWKENPTKEMVLNIAARSAEFKAINNMLDAGGKLADVKLTESYIVRYEEKEK